MTFMLLTAIALAIGITDLAVVQSKVVHVVSGMEETGMIREYSDAVLKCYTDDDPSHVYFSWYINSRLITGETGIEFLISNVTREFHKVTIQCRALNNLGKASMSSVILNVTYSPRFRSRPYLVKAEIGTSVSLYCEAEGNPSPNYVWIHEKSKKIVAKTCNYFVIADLESDGIYYCEVFVTGFPKIQAKYEILIKSHSDKMNTNVLILIITNIVMIILFSIIMGLVYAIRRRTQKLIA